MKKEEAQELLIRLKEQCAKHPNPRYEWEVGKDAFFDGNNYVLVGKRGYMSDVELRLIANFCEYHNRTFSITSYYPPYVYPAYAKDEGKVHVNPIGVDFVALIH